MTWRFLLLSCFPCSRTFFYKTKMFLRIAKTRQELKKEKSDTLRRNAGTDATEASNCALVASFSGLAVCDSNFEAVVEAKSSKTILDLPFEVLSIIFQQLDHFQIAKCAQVCKKFNEVSKDPKLFLDIRLLEHSPKGYAEWMISRTAVPKKLFMESEFPFSIIDKLPTWNMLEELDLLEADLREFNYCSFVKLRRLSVVRCDFNCNYIEQMLHQSKDICKIELVSNRCTHCGWKCDTGGVPWIDFRFHINSIEDVYICSMSGISPEHLKQLSECINLKKLRLKKDYKSGDFTEEAALGMEMVARKCINLELVVLLNLNFITDDVLTILFVNCKKLKEVQLSGLPKITEKSCLVAINVLPRLQEICISTCSLVPQSSETELRRAIDNLKTRERPTLFMSWARC